MVVVELVSAMATADLVAVNGSSSLQEDGLYMC